MQHAPGFMALCEEARQQITEISAQDTLARLQSGGILLIDVREDREAARGTIQGANHLGRGVIERDIEQAMPNKAQEIILYCGGGYRSALAALNLQRMGYTNVKSMAGGWRAWNELNYPVAQPKA